MTLKSYIEEREENNIEFKCAFAKYQPQIECVRILTEAQSKYDLTLKELEKITGIKSRKLRQLQNGKRIPTLKVLQKIAEGLGKRIEVNMVE